MKIWKYLAPIPCWRKKDDLAQAISVATPRMGIAAKCSLMDVLLMIQTVCPITDASKQKEHLIAMNIFGPI